jgi:hypothetical protein
MIEKLMTSSNFVFGNVASSFWIFFYFFKISLFYN